MAEESTVSQAHEQVLLVAGRLFCERGYASVTMRDLAEALNMRQASLYYHAPEGKEQLFAEVIEQDLTRRFAGIERAIAQTEPQIGKQLRAVALFLISQPPLDLVRFFRSDLPALSELKAYRLLKLAHRTLIAPCEDLFNDAYQRGEIRLADATLMAATFLSNIDVIHEMHRYKPTPKEVLVQDMLDAFLDGLRRR
ncbi:MAG TPA: TetR/AcrR family transcriptional regulator [Ktedonobacteraceae bacterium]|nr:TetR/AcrR family transcriptional regulator [Ktedonobacteraceae bacterium]